jgi:hypothetical protein
MTKEEFATLIKGSKAYFPNFILDKLQMSLWYDALDDLEYQVTQKAIKKLAQTTEFAPTIAAIRKTYIEMVNGEKPSLEQTLNDLNALTRYPYGRYNVVEGMTWLQEKNPTAYRVLKSLGYETYANNDINYLMPTVIKLHKEIVEHDTDIKLLQSKFCVELGKAKTKALAMNGDDYDE